MEWTVKEVRSFLGKFSGRNMAARGRTVSLLKENKATKDTMGAEGDFIPTTHELDLTVIFCESRLWSHRANLWRLMMDGDGTSGAADAAFLLSPDGEKINSDVMYLISTAQERLRTYIKKFYLEG